MAPKRGADLRRQKERRQKLIALVGGILLLALLAVQGPKTLGRLRGDSTTAAQPATAGAPSAGATDSASAPPATAFVLHEPNESAAVSSGQLATLDRFAGKDPFVPQVSLDGPAAATSSTTSATPQRPSAGTGPKTSESTAGITGKRTAGGAAGKRTAGSAPRITTTPPATETTAAPGTGTTPVPGSTTTPDGSTVTTPTAPTVTTPAPGTTTTPGSTTSGVPPAGASPVSTTVVISTNGKSEQVTVGAEFPQADPIFRLVSVSEKGVRIGIADGSYATGAEATLLVRGKLLTLMNTATGARYELRLLPGS